MFDEIVGSSIGLQKVLRDLERVAKTDSTVLITGETGTGKELIANAIHRRSLRSGSNLIKVNCAALPAELIASELFGHERGAFTGALQQRIGRFEAANGGTIFLDEIGELSPEMQIALLRVLQEKEFERVGGNRTIRTDVRVIAATNRDLEFETAEGRFRPDLYYRLNVFPVHVPPLRERVEDIPILACHFAAHFAGRMGRQMCRIDRDTLSAMQRYTWPGNIRELQNVIERGVILSDGEVFCLPPNAWRCIPPVEYRLRRVPSVRIEIEDALKESSGRVSGPQGAAVRLGVPASTLESRIRALSINKFQFRDARSLS
jgi:formate hydrogenlyase transcriptional activator